MTTMLNPAFIGSQWDQIYNFIKEALSDDEQNDAMKTNLLKGIMAGLVQVWLSHRDGSAVGVLVTYAMRDSFNEIPFLYICAFATLGNSKVEDWRDAIDSIKAFAKNRGCSKVTAATDNAAIVRLCGSLGAENHTTLLTWEVS